MTEPAPGSVTYVDPRGCICPDDCGESCGEGNLSFDLFELEVRVEPLGRYGPRGYYPMTLRERLSNDRYTVYHKPGHGDYSTVWLAHDETEKRQVAIKVMAAVDESLEKHARGEMETLRCIESLPDNHPGKALMLPLLDLFVHEGPTGNHECYVTVPHKFSIKTTKKDSGRLDAYFSLDVARAIVAQLIIAVSFLHENGIVHGASRNPSSLSPDQVCDKIGCPEKWKIPTDNDEATPPGCPSILVLRPEMGEDNFGLSWKPEEETRYSVYTPLLYRAPEAMFSEREQTPISFPSDIWSLGMMIYCVYARGLILEAVDLDDSTLADMICLLGKPPQRWWDMWEGKNLYFEENGEWIKGKHMRHHPEYVLLEERMRDWLGDSRKGNITDEETKDLLDLLRQTFKWEPEERAPATELLETTWMTKLGVPALEAMHLARGEDRNVLAGLPSITGQRKEAAWEWTMILRNPFRISAVGPRNWLKRFFGWFGLATGVRWWMGLQDVFGRFF